MCAYIHTYICRKKWRRGSLRWEIIKQDKFRRGNNRGRGTIDKMVRRNEIRSNGRYKKYRKHLWTEILRRNNLELSDVYIRIHIPNYIHIHIYIYIYICIHIYNYIHIPIITIFIFIFVIIFVSVFIFIFLKPDWYGLLSGESVSWVVYPLFPRLSHLYRFLNNHRELLLHSFSKILSWIVYWISYHLGIFWYFQPV